MKQFFSLKNLKTLRDRFRDLPLKLSEAISQTFFVLIFSFVPIIGISIKKVLEVEVEVEGNNFPNVLNSYFSKGEICFFILSVIGAIFWSIISRKYRKNIKTFLLASIAIIMILTLVYVGDNNFPVTEITQNSQKLLWVIYFFTLVIWFFSLFGEVEVKSTSSKKHTDGENQDTMDLVKAGQASRGE